MEYFVVKLHPVLDDSTSCLLIFLFIIWWSALINGHMDSISKCECDKEGANYSDVKKREGKFYNLTIISRNKYKKKSSLAVSWHKKQEYFFYFVFFIIEKQKDSK